jgi:hypothetical protein
MSVVVVGILALAALAYVASALGKPDRTAPGRGGLGRTAEQRGGLGRTAEQRGGLGRTAEETRPDPAEVELERQARAALVAIVDLENERDVGKLTSEDFEALVGTYEHEALAALRGLDDVRSGGEADAVERDIAAVRARLRTRPPGSEPR